jgi:hypothetical protein
MAFIKGLQKFYTLYKENTHFKAMKVGFRATFWSLVCLIAMTSSNLMAIDYPEKVRIFTRPIEFDYVTWTIQAIWQKTLQQSVHLEDYLPAPRPSEIVREYLKRESQIAQLESDIAIIYADPNMAGNGSVLQNKQQQLDQIRQIKAMLAPVAESTLQEQIGDILDQNNLTFLGQPVPPVLYHSTPLPMALIVSPRNKIQQDANISLSADMTAGDMTELEVEVMKKLDVSALVVPVGGVGIYPTMVMATSDLSFLADTVAHEWTHNFLTIRPLGLNYETNSELRTINETTASIVGTEIGQQLLKKYYPDLLPPEQEPIQVNVSFKKKDTGQNVTPEEFSFRNEMNKTRVQVDELLSAGKVTEAEDYMEQRRLIFWDHGYPIRRLNQAYFAFYGAYADVPGGAAGKDPVGPMVRAFRAQSGSLAEFLERISWVTSYSQLVGMVMSSR